MNSPFLFGLRFEVAVGAVGFDHDLGAVDRLALRVGDDALDHTV